MNKSLFCLTINLGLTMVASAQGSKAHNKKIAKDIASNIKTLNSDGYNERAVGSAGDNKTANFIASQFKSIGLEPKGDNEYSQNLNVPNLRMAQGNSSLLIDGKVQTLFSDYFPVSASSNNGRYSGEAVNIGYGIDDGGLKIYSYNDKDVKGKAVIINTGLPGDPSQYSKFGAWESIESRANYAKSKGAKAVILHSSNPDFKPSGTLEKSLKNSKIPVLFVNKYFSKTESLKIELRVDILLLSTQSQNILGYIDNKAKTTVLISTHHDNTYENWEDLQTNSRSVSVLISLAKEIKSNPKKFVNNNYLFVSFTGYEDNFLGTKYFLGEELIKYLNLNYILSLDNIGNLDSNNQILTLSGKGTSPLWPQVIDKYSPKKIQSFITNNKIDSTSESSLFYQNEIPILSIEARSKYTEESKRPKKGFNEARITSYLCSLLYRSDNLTAQYSEAEGTANSPEKVLHKIPFTKITNTN